MERKGYREIALASIFITYRQAKSETQYAVSFKWGQDALGSQKYLNHHNRFRKIIWQYLLKDMGTPCDPEMNTYVPQKTCIRIYTGALFIID